MVEPFQGRQRRWRAKIFFSKCGEKRFKDTLEKIFSLTESKRLKEFTWMSRVNIRNSSSLASDSPMQCLFPGFKQITLWLRTGIGTYSKRKESFVTDKTSFLVKKSLWLEFIWLVPMIRVPEYEFGCVLTWSLELGVTSWCSKALRRQMCPWESCSLSLEKLKICHWCSTDMGMVRVWMCYRCSYSMGISMGKVGLWLVE